MIWNDLKNGKAGFSLVEVCLAIAVVGIGLLGVFSLFPAGLSMNKKNTDATVSTMFAEDVLNGLHAIIDSEPSKWNASVTQWKTDKDLTNGYPTAESIWRLNESTRGLDLSGKVATNKYVNHEGYEDIALRYKTTFTQPYPGKVRQARLVVWNGEFGSSDEKDGYLFITTFFNYGM